MELGIAGRRAAVAAASTGLGFSVAAALAAEGVEVAICGRDRARIDEAARRIGSLAHPFVVDVGTPSGASDFIRQSTAALGGVDIVVLNCGGPPAGSIAELDIAAFREAIEQNLLAAVEMCAEAVPLMLASGWGRVLGITSITARQPVEGMVLSNTARAGVTAYLKTLSLELSGSGVTVNSLQPGPHGTDRLRALRAAEKSGTAAVTGDPRDFGAMATILCSEQARFTTGVHLPIDGGLNRGLQ